MAAKSYHFCSGCTQFVSRATYYRHLTPGVCPGNVNEDPNGVHVITDDVDERDDTYMNTDSPNELPSENESKSPACDDDDDDEIELIADGFDSDTTCDLNEERPSTGSDPDQPTHTSSLVEFSNKFLVYFQLKFNIPERGLQLLLYFLSFFVEFVCRLNSNEILTLKHELPKTNYMLKKQTTEWNNTFIQYCICCKCECSYNIDDCISQKVCSYVQYPNHPHKSRRNSCQGLLVQKIKCQSGYNFHPKKVYIYNSIIENVKLLMSHPNFVRQCGIWKELQRQPGVLTDIYDGELWERFRKYGSKLLLDVPHNLGFMLNVDWLQPYEHSQYSVGVLYLSILNLPRSERYKLENIIVVGCIPGPSEPRNMNSYLKPMVDELLMLWDGIDIQPHSYAVPVQVRGCLLGVACDIPATRKVCGFTGCSSTHGCSKCFKTFSCSAFGEKLDYSGFDRDNWPLRTLDQHWDALLALDNASCQTQSEQVEKEFGVRYSELVRLPYFNIIEQHVVDTMHNMSLGTSKHCVSTWKDLRFLGAAQCEVIQQKVDNMIVPYGVGRIPLKICSKFSGLTADQWRNWTNIYSLYALKGILPDEHYSCWAMFVEASMQLSQHPVSVDVLTAADTKLVQFCSTFEQLYGKQACTPNMHMHCHIMECILNYGPASAFWLYPFERYNGIMQSFVDNWMMPEMQMMKRFTAYQRSSCFEHTGIPTELHADRYEGSLLETTVDVYEKVSYQQNASCNVSEINALMLPSIHKIGSRIVEKYFSDSDLYSITQVYSLLYSGCNSQVPHIAKAHGVFNDLTIMGERFLSVKSRSQRSCIIIAKWCGANGQIDAVGSSIYRCGEVQYFIQHIMLNPENNTTDKHLFAAVKWFKCHPRQFTVAKPLQILCTDFEPEGPATFIPVSRIKCRCAISPKELIQFDYGEDCVYIVCPMTFVI